MTMNAFRSLFLTGACVIGAATPAFAQLPAPPVPVPVPGQSNNGQRVPDNTVEGIIFEYSGTLDPATKSKGEDKPIEGRFRLEKSAIFDLSPTIKVPTKEDVDKVLSG